MVACSSRVIVAATTEKLGARGNWQIASLDEIDDLVLTTTHRPHWRPLPPPASRCIPPPLTDRHVRQPRACRTARDPRCVLIPGFATALWATLVPFASHAPDISDATLGLVLLCLGAGSLLAMPLSERARRAWLPSGDGGQQLLICLSVPGWPGRLGLAAGLVLFVFGAAVGAMDCTMNVQAVIVEREARRVMMSGFRLLQHRRLPRRGHHDRAAVGTAATVGVGADRRRRHAAGDAAVGVVLAQRRMPHDADAGDHARHRAVGVLAFVAFLGEGDAGLERGVPQRRTSCGCQPGRHRLCDLHPDHDRRAPVRRCAGGTRRSPARDRVRRRSPPAACWC
jgi:hypothetical protein